MSEKDKANLLAINDSCLKILKFSDEFWDVDSFYNDDKTFDAVLMNFVIIGESVTRLSTELKETKNHIQWIKIKGFRNIVVHDYFGVDAEEVWQIIKNEIPKLLDNLNKIINNSKSD